MKKKLLLSLLLAAVVLTSASVGAFAATKLTLIVNGQKAAVDPVVIKGVTYVPVRAAATLLGADVKYDASSGTVTVTSKETPQTSPKPMQSTLKSFNVDITVKSGPMILKISKVTLDPAYKQYSFESASHNVIILDVTVENTSSDKMTWYVDQSKLVLNTKEQVEKTLMGDNRITSDFNGNVVKKGQIVFEVKDSKLDDISSMRMLIKYVIDDNWTTIAEDTETEIILK